MARESYGAKFSNPCNADLEELRDVVLSAVDALDMHGEYAEEYAVSGLLALADDMIEYLEQKDL